MEQNFLPGTLFAIDELVGHFGEISDYEISLPRASGFQSGYFRRTPLDRRVNDYTVKIDVHASIYYGLAWQHFRRQIPRLLLHNPILDRLCNQFSDLFTLQRN